ncbi:MAG: 8-oxo-dGTP diphosphatase [Pseudohongiellaceae bacterium]|jgi:8-oxo-dGTP diphosphatase
MQARFCTACGGPLEPREVEGRLRGICTQCDQVSYENPVPAAAVIVCREVGGKREILLGRRAIDPYLGEWGLPAGYQEIDETIETTAVREAREETGLIILLTGLHDVMTTRDDPRKPSILVVFEGAVVDGEMEPGDDCDEVGFFSLDDLPERLAFRNNRIILERLRKREIRPWPVNPNP